MSSINSIGGAQGGQPVQKVTTSPVQKSDSTESAAQPKPIRDRVELSGMSGMLKTLKSGNDVRADKIAAIKAQIEAGTYEDDHKLDVAADRLLDDLLK